MRSFVLGAGCWAFSLAIAAGASAQVDVRKSIQAQYNRWSKAYMANDIDTLLDVLTPDYTLTSIDKDVMTYGVYKAYLKLKKLNPKDTTHYETKIRRLSVRGVNADVDSVESMTTSAKDRTGHPVVTTHRHEYLDRWRLANGVWRLFRTTTLKESTTSKHG